MQILHPENFTMPLEVVDSKSDSNRVYAAEAVVMRHTPEPMFSAFSVVAVVPLHILSEPPDFP